MSSNPGIEELDPLARLERISQRFESEKRWWRRLVVVGIILTGFLVVLHFQSRVAVQRADEAIVAVDEDRRQQGIQMCERVNILRQSTHDALVAGETLLHQIIAPLRTPRPDFTPAEKTARENFLSVVDRELAIYHEQLNKFQLTNCEAVIPTLNINAQEGI